MYHNNDPTFFLRFLSAYSEKQTFLREGMQGHMLNFNMYHIDDFTFLLRFLSAYRVKNKPSVKRGCKSVCKTSTFDGGNVYERICWMKCE